MKQREYALDVLQEAEAQLLNLPACLRGTTAWLKSVIDFRTISCWTYQPFG